MKQNIISPIATVSPVPHDHTKPLPFSLKLDPPTSTNALREKPATITVSRRAEPDNVSECTEATTIEKTFTVHFGAGKYEMTGEHCAKALRVAIARLEILENSFRLAIDEGE